LNTVDSSSEKRQKYVLADSVCIYFNGTDEVRIRKGIWNYEEAILSFEGFSDLFKQTLLYHSAIDIVH